MSILLDAKWTASWTNLLQAELKVTVRIHCCL